jgi:ribosomal protein S18 acetylase RimI-like enzyme
VWIAEADGRALGTIASSTEGDVTYIRGMGVYPSARGPGVGRALVNTCVADAIATGATVARLHTTEFLHAAISLYEAAGFMVVPNSDKPDLFRTPLIAMERVLQ